MEIVRKKKIKPDSDKVVEVEGTVVAGLPKLEYTVEIDYKGLKHTVTCHVSGKMRTRFIELEKGDKVLVRISLYDIDRGIIFRRLTLRTRGGIAPAPVESPESANLQNPE